MLQESFQTSIVVPWHNLAELRPPCRISTEALHRETSGERFHQSGKSIEFSDQKKSPCNVINMSNLKLFVLGREPAPMLRVANSEASEQQCWGRDLRELIVLPDHSSHRIEQPTTFNHLNVCLLRSTQLRCSGSRPVAVCAPAPHNPATRLPIQARTSPHPHYASVSTDCI